ncbi:MAG: hypothetical protein COC01_02660 [Bacteroidetes bacterium]|nr:MAG: hypothetical protein COC01_02660 [Bacteroidota bacterium]
MTYTILIADDNVSNLDLVQFILNPGADEYEFYTTTNGKDAVSLATEHNPDLILLDWHMPEMTGIQALTKLKKNPQTKDIPVLIITGDPTELNIGLAFNAGARDYLRKPFNEIELTARVKAALKEGYYKKNLLEPLQEVQNLCQKANDSINNGNTDGISKIIIECNDKIKTIIKDL